MSTKNKLSDLRNHLFETIESLKDEEKPMDIGRAKAIAEVAQVIIQTAKVELEAVDVLGQESTGKFSDQIEPLKLNGKVN